MGKEQIFASGFLKIPIFGDFNPEKVIFEGRKMGEKGVNDKILKNPAAKNFSSPKKPTYQISRS